jgi:hypothetical protein
VSNFDLISNPGIVIFHSREKWFGRKSMYTVTVCIILATLVLVVASVAFAATLAVVIISHGAKRASSALQMCFRRRIAAWTSEARLMRGLVPRRAR